MTTPESERATQTSARRRVRRLVDDVLRPALDGGAVAVPAASWEAPDEPVPWSLAVQQAFQAIRVGDRWGYPWGSTWFRLDIGGVRDSVGSGPVELVVDIGFDHTRPGFQCEATVWDDQGRIVKALEPMNHRVPLTNGRESVASILIEASSNPNVLFEGPGSDGSRLRNSATDLGDVLTAPRARMYRFGGARLRPLRPELEMLLGDIEVLEGILRVVPEDSRRFAVICSAFQDLLDAVDPASPLRDAAEGRRALVNVLSAPAATSAAVLHTVGHAHIDSAWLWPIRETRRKVARTFANVLELMDSRPEFTFAASSAQQYAWVQEDHPELFERIAARVAEGRFIPVGGMWVESDTNLPSGESLVRQFVEGTRYFIDAFGIETEELWLPDSFGYTGALPQIATAAGKRYALIEKLSWNDTNRLPVTTFAWEGIDGSSILTHLPSVDIYNTDLRAEDLVRAERQLHPRGRLTHALVPFGYGDGGGGPTREMLASALRARDIEGLPRVIHSSPARFFEAAGDEVTDDLRWTGELYLESSRGTYTSQRAMKVGNRRMERLLVRAEHVAAVAALRTGAAYPYARLRELWRSTLLLQFHDILPGTSIAWVHREARDLYERLAADAEAIIDRAVSELGVCSTARSEPDGPMPRVARIDGGHVLENGLIRVVVDDAGLVVSLVDLAGERELVAPGGRIGELQVFRDTPGEYDAWELDADYPRVSDSIRTVDRIDPIDDDGVVGVEVARSFGASRFRQRYLLRRSCAALELETSVEWRESRKLLKLSFDVDAKSESATFGTQFGHLERPITTNTSWDKARFEVPAHGFVWVGAQGQGVAVCNDAIYGHDLRRMPRPGGGSIFRVRQSLLRSPQFPDPETDQGEHTFRSSIRAGGDVTDALDEAGRLDDLAVAPVPPDARLVTLSDGHDRVALDAVKLADDGSGDVVVRFHEALGRFGRTRIHITFPARSVRRVDLLERELESEPLQVIESAIEMAVRPFELVTLRFAVDATQGSGRND